MNENQKIDLNNMMEVICFCEENDIPMYVRHLWGGYQILGVGWDVVCHSSSYGHECGLLESMGLDWGQPGEYTDVVGYLTGEKVIDGIKCKYGL